MQWQTITRRVPSRSMTVVGDIAQTGSPAGATSWPVVLDELAGGGWRIEQLTVNYRTPATVMELATGMLAAHAMEVAPPKSAREGQWSPVAVRLPGRDPESVTAATLEILTEDDDVLGGGQLAVLVPRSFPAETAVLLRDRLARRDQVAGGAGPGAEAEASRGLAERVEILTVDQAKGLEFDAVTVIDPAGVLADSARGLADLYVALTRPTQRLAVLHHGDLPPGLDHLF